MHPRFHVTPLRASRGLALRFLGQLFGVPLERFVVLLPAPAVAEDCENEKIWVRPLAPACPATPAPLPFLRWH